MGGIVGTYFSIKNTQGPKERAFRSGRQHIAGLGSQRSWLASSFCPFPSVCCSGSSTCRRCSGSSDGRMRDKPVRGSKTRPRPTCQATMQAVFNKRRCPDALPSGLSSSCGPRPERGHLSSGTWPGSEPEETYPESRRLFEEVVKTYRDSPAYSDKGVLQVEFVSVPNKGAEKPKTVTGKRNSRSLGRTSSLCITDRCGSFAMAT